MTEEEWLGCTDPQKMLESLNGKASDRKSRLYLCECFRRIPSERLPGNVLKAIIVHERYAEKLASRKDLLDARSRAWESVNKFAVQNCRSRSGPTPEDRLHHARMAAIARATSPEIDDVIHLANPQLLPVPERLHQVGLLRDIFGNPFRRFVIDPSWLVWNDATVAKLAQAIYVEWAFHLLPILADALEEAGGHDAAILAHCRGPGPHVRGCWVVDLLLGKE
jgi:hypothetical protein